MWTIARLLSTSMFILIFMVSNPQSARAKAYFSPKLEMIENSEVIAVVDIQKVNAVEKPGLTHSYMKEGDVKVEQRLKGDIPDQFKLYGCENFICARADFQPGKYLVLLNKCNDLWVASNYHFSIRPIKDGKIEWYGEGFGPLVPVAADKVLSEIRASVGDPKKLAALKAPLKVLAKADILEDELIGEAPGPSPVQKAYAEAKKTCLDDVSQLETLYKYGTPVGKIYASLLMTAAKHPEEAKKLLATLSHCRGSLTYKSGCRMTTAGVWTAASDLYSNGRFLNLKLSDSKIN